MTYLTSLILFWAPVYGINPQIALAVAQHESGLNPDAVGALGEIGVFQIRPEFSSEYTRKQLFIPEINVKLGLQKLAEAKQMCVHQKENDWLTCYNLGIEGAKHLKYPRLFPYVKDIERKMVSL